MSGLLLACDVGVEFWNPTTCRDPGVQQVVRKALICKNEAVKECLVAGKVTCDPSALSEALRCVPVSQWGKIEASPIEIVYT